MARKSASLEVERWHSELGKVSNQLSARFARREMKVRCEVYLECLLAQVDRKNGWQLAEYAGDATPKNIQHFIGRAKWDADQVRDDLQDYVEKQLGAPDGVLIVDETGFLKKGSKSAGVARQYSGTAGRIENSQIGVFMAYRSKKGHTLIDRELYLPQAWTADRPRCREAAISDEVVFATKPELARRMLKRALGRNIRAGWVVADEVYGSDSKLRQLLKKEGVGYVVTVACNQHLFLDGVRTRVDEHVRDLPSSAWKKLSCGDGTKGKRYYHWAYRKFGSPSEASMQSGLLVRRSLTNPDELAYFFTSSPAETKIQKLVTVAGSRWAIEECFEQAKQETGLDEYEVRTWHAWYRHITLSMFAHAMLVAIRHRANRTSKKSTQSPN
jgi:SRSO17 transposase